MGRHKDKDKDRDHKKKKHKHKDSSRKKDKKKSSKKSSSKRKHDNVSDSYSSSGSDTSYASDNERMGELEGGWVEKSTGDIEEPKVVMESESRVEEEKPKLHRESWMSAPPPPRVAAKKEDEEKKRLEEEEKRRKEPKISHSTDLELNPYFKDGGDGLPPQETDAKRKHTYGDSGSSWRMIKLKRVYETAKEEGRPVEQVGTERFGSFEDFQDAVAERQFLDSKGRGGGDRRNDKFSSRSSETTTLPPKRDESSYRSMPASSAFMKPKDLSSSSSSSSSKPSQPSSSTSRLSRPLPTMFPTAPQQQRQPPAQQQQQQETSTEPIPTLDQLNRLKSQILKAQLKNDKSLEEQLSGEYNEAKQRYDAHQEIGGNDSKGKNVVILPDFVVDSRGKLVDISGKLSSSSSSSTTGKRQQPDQLSIQDMILAEKMASQASVDMDIASRIAKDAMFKPGLDYLEDFGDKMEESLQGKLPNKAKRKESDREQKRDDKRRRIGIEEYLKQQNAVADCSFCWNESQLPKLKVLSYATKTYLAVSNKVDILPGYCLIIPTQHVSNMLELDDEAYEEVRNYMKTLIHFFGSLSPTPQSVIFAETVITHHRSRHTVIECIPLPTEKWELAPQYFKESLQASADEWSTHRKVIETDNSRGGFRRSLVKELPYFHVWFNPNGGLGHVIEKEGFREWYAREIVGGMMDLGPERWRKLRYLGPDEAQKKVKWFNDNNWGKFDWATHL